jgi:hypothetical protein
MTRGERPPPVVASRRAARRSRTPSRRRSRNYIETMISTPAASRRGRFVRTGAGRRAPPLACAPPTSTARPITSRPGTSGTPTHPRRTGTLDGERSTRVDVRGVRRRQRGVSRAGKRRERRGGRRRARIGRAAGRGMHDAIWRLGRIAVPDDEPARVLDRLDGSGLAQAPLAEVERGIAATD